MKVVILAGGYGTVCLSIQKIPKPMVEVLKVPILERIIKYYSKFNFKNFIIAAGYKEKLLNNI